MGSDGGRCGGLRQRFTTDMMVTEMLPQTLERQKSTSKRNESWDKYSIGM